MTIIIILAILFITLVVVVPLIERSNFRMTGEQMGKWGRWILPLLVVMLIVQLVMHYTS